MKVLWILMMSLSLAVFNSHAAEPTTLQAPEAQEIEARYNQAKNLKEFVAGSQLSSDQKKEFFKSIEKNKLETIALPTATSTKHKFKIAKWNLEIDFENAQEGHVLLNSKKIDLSQKRSLQDIEDLLFGPKTSLINWFLSVAWAQQEQMKELNAAARKATSLTVATILVPIPFGYFAYRAHAKKNKLSDPERFLTRAFVNGDFSGFVCNGRVGLKEIQIREPASTFQIQYNGQSKAEIAVLKNNQGKVCDFAIDRNFYILKSGLKQWSCDLKGDGMGALFKFIPLKIMNKCCQSETCFNAVAENVARAKADASGVSGSKSNSKIQTSSPEKGADAAP